MTRKKDIAPPRLADRFFRFYCKNHLAESIEGDLYERYLGYREEFSKFHSDLKYWLDVFRFMNRHTLKRSNRSYQSNLNNLPMIRNYIIVAYRNIRRNLSFTAINILGLSVSMAVCFVIIALINDQTSYDDFNENRSKVYRVIHNRINHGIDLPIATTPVPLGQKIKDEFPAAKRTTQFTRGLSGEVLQNGKAISINGLFTDPDFFDLFAMGLQTGHQETALEEPYSIVLREDIAVKFFKDQDPIGQTLDIGELGQFKVTGVLEEIPGKSHLSFEALASFSSIPTLEAQDKVSKTLTNWENTSGGWVYFEISTNQKPELQTYLDKLAKEFYTEESEYQVAFSLQCMTDITPGPLMGNQIGESMPNFFVYGLVILAVLIMSCAAFNYANLSTARALTRFKEVGVRKVMGSSKTQLVIQFMVESVLVAVLSLIMAIALLRLMIPGFESLSLSSLLNWEINPDAKVYFQFLVFSIVAGLVVGFFPALYMASAKSINALKGIEAPRMSKINLRKSLIVMQLAISIILITSSTLVYRQIKYMISHDYGFNHEQVVSIDLQGQDFDLLKPELEKLSFVTYVSGCNNIPSTGSHDDIKVRLRPSDEPTDFYYYTVDHSYMDMMELELISGQNFDPGQTATDQIIVNQTGLAQLGVDDRQDVIGTNVILEDSTKARIVGVAKDYNFMMLYMPIKPMVLRYTPSEFQWAQVKVAGSDLFSELDQLEKTWNKFDPNHDIEYQMMEEQIAEFYGVFYDIVYIVGLISILSVIIAGLGLLGITSYSMRTRLKEVGIRKILGAEKKDLMILLGKSFLILIGVSTLVGALLSYFGNSLWLNMFAYRVDFGLDIVITAFAFIAVIGGLTLGTQTWIASETNPSEVLKNE